MRKGRSTVGPMLQIRREVSAETDRDRGAHGSLLSERESVDSKAHRGQNAAGTSNQLGTRNAKSYVT